MKVEIEKLPVYETKRVIKEYKENKQYIADDGKVFKTEKECLHYEIELSFIKKAKEVIKVFNFDVYNDEIANLFFSGWGTISCVLFFRFKIDTQSISLLADYLRVLGGGNISENDLKKFTDGEEVIGCSYDIDEHTDYPSYGSSIISVQEFKREFEKFNNTILSNLL